MYLAKNFQHAEAIYVKAFEYAVSNSFWPFANIGPPITNIRREKTLLAKLFQQARRTDGLM